MIISCLFRHFSPSLRIIFNAFHPVYHVLNSQVAALVPQIEIDVVIGGNHKDIQSQIMTQALRKIHYSLCHSQTLIVFVNQVGVIVK